MGKKLTSKPETGTMTIEQPPPTHMPELGQELDNLEHQSPIAQIDRPMIEKEIKKLAFNEEWIRITLVQTQYYNPVNPEDHFQEWQPCMLQGEGAEVMLGSQIVRMRYLPFNTSLTIKRKYAEMLMLSRNVTVRTEVNPHFGQNRNPTNEIRRTVSAPCSIQIDEDKSPYRDEWLRRVHAQRIV
jgi:hypothetical protein